MEPNPAPSPHPSRALAAAALALAGLEVALTGLVHALAAAGVCPAGGDSLLGCAALIRPRVGALLGPIGVSHVALVGAAVSLVLVVSLLAGKLGARGARAGSSILAGGAGFAIGIQALTPIATGTVCPLCLLIAACAVGVAVCFGAAVRQRFGGSVEPAVRVLMSVTIVVLALAALRGNQLSLEDERRRALVELASETPAGPELVVVVRDGCPYCDALILDGLGDPAVLRVLARTRALRTVDADGPEGRALARHSGAPLLVVVEGERELGRLVGLRGPAELVAWLEGLLGRG